MEKFSVIIPTLWKSDTFSKLAVALNNTEAVGEIILINNGGSEEYTKLRLKTQPEKVRDITPKTNLFVNPSWNLGVREAKYNNICICNDDILFNTDVLNKLSEIDLKSLGLIGMSQHNYNCQDSAELILRNTGVRNWGYGCLMFIHKDNYIPIPEEMKVWCGDDYLFHNQKNMNFVIRGLNIHTQMSTTSDLPEFDEIKQNDLKVYENYNRTHSPA